MFGYFAAHLDQGGIVEKVTVLFSVKNCELIPKESHEGERGPQNRVSGADVLIAVAAVFILNGVVHRSDSGDRLANLVA